MPVELDRMGIPQYSGNPEEADEYVERTWDYFFGLVETAQAPAAVRLRSGLTGRAYEAARSLKHTELTTGEIGVSALLAAVEQGIHKERPIRITELFDSAFYSASVWRATGEDIPSYIKRRQREFDELKKVSPSTIVSNDIIAHILLKFSV